MEGKLQRLATYRNWPNSAPVLPSELADAGFFYTQISDEVQCFSCHVKIHEWTVWVSPIEKHRNVSPNCEYILTKTVGHVRDIPNPNHSQNHVTNSRIGSIDTLNELRNNNQSITQNISRQISAVDPMQRQTPTRSPPLIIKTNNDVFRVISENGRNGCEWYKPRLASSSEVEVDYTVESNRVASYMNRWDIGNPLKPDELASAGLYYTGPGDRVQCAFCRGGLYNWAYGDTALGEHVRHFPSCNFAQEKLQRLLNTQPAPEKYEEEKPVSHEKNDDTDTKDWENCPAVKIAENMGYQSDIIKKAVEKVFSVSCDRLSSSVLMEAIFEIEKNTATPRTQAPKRERSLSGGYQINSINESLEGAVGGEEPRHKAVQKCTIQAMDLPTVSKVTNTNIDEELKRLMEENLRLKGNTTCKVCLDNDVDMLFLPCRHLVCCEGCANELKQCPCCRAQIVGTVKTYLS